jgi:mono/diheme cytochrome c family protein
MMRKNNLAALVAGSVMLLASCAFAQDAARLAAGEAAWDKAGCPQCHGASGEGGSGGESVAGPSLRTTRLDRAMLIDTIGCGRPGTEMPAWLAGAYTEIACYGAKGPVPPGLDRIPVLNVEEVAALVDFLLAKVVGK